MRGFGAEQGVVIRVFVVRDFVWGVLCVPRWSTHGRGEGGASGAVVGRRVR